MNDRAAATALAKAVPSIERDRSITTSMLFARARFCALSPMAGSPFSRTVGAVDDGVGVTTDTLTVGYPETSSPVNRGEFAADAGAARSSAAMTMKEAA